MIENPVQTERALLTWQRPLSAGGRRDRFAVGVFRQSSDGVAFEYFPEDALQEARSHGYRSYPGLLPSAERTRTEALSVMMRRLPPRDRSDFPDFMMAFGLSPEANFTDLSILAYTGARVKSDSDSFGITETFDGFDRPFDYVFDIAGVRHYLEALSAADEDNEVLFRHDAENEHDSNAVEVLTLDGERLGYLNKFQAHKMLEWLSAGSVVAQVLRKNGRPDYPRLFVQAHINP